MTTPLEHVEGTHDWVMIATFAVEAETVQKMNQQTLLQDKDKGPVPVQMDQDHLLTVDGPGCAWCGVEWQVGYGKACGTPVDGG